MKTFSFVKPQQPATSNVLSTTCDGGGCGSVQASTHLRGDYESWQPATYRNYQKTTGDNKLATVGKWKQFHRIRACSQRGCDVQVLKVKVQEEDNISIIDRQIFFTHKRMREGARLLLLLLLLLRHLASAVMRFEHISKNSIV